MEVTETLLPGVGVCYSLQTAAGARVGIVAKRDGSFDFVRYEQRDPDAAETLMTLTRDEADTLAEILGAPRIVERFADLTKEIPGLSSANIDIPQGSAYDGRTLGDTRSRTLTGASIVAIARGEHVIASPGPSEVLLGGDTLVVVGTTAGIDGVRRILVG
jgi:TrkA domain protein